MSVRKEKILDKYMIVLITKPEDGRALSRAEKALGLPIAYQLRGQGTANSEILDIVGLEGTQRMLSLLLVGGEKLSQVLELLNRQLRLSRRGHGIAVALRVNGMQETIRKILEDRDMRARDMKVRDMKEGEGMTDKDRSYSMILVAADQGYSEDIIEAARHAGARGGTVVRGRRQGGESVMTLLGMSNQEEQEFIMIIVGADRRGAVMEAVASSFGLASPAHGGALSLPVEAAIGLEPQEALE